MRTEPRAAAGPRRCRRARLPAQQTTRRLLAETLATGPVPNVSPQWLEAQIDKLRSVWRKGEQSLLEAVLLATLKRVRKRRPAADAPVISRSELIAMFERGAVRLTLRDGRQFMLPGNNYMLPPDRNGFLLLTTHGEGLVFSNLAEVQFADPVWPDAIELAPDDRGAEAGPAREGPRDAR
jgi:hypothetical protein